MIGPVGVENSVIERNYCSELISDGCIGFETVFPLSPIEILIFAYICRSFYSICDSRY